MHVIPALEASNGVAHRRTLQRLGVPLAAVDAARRAGAVGCPRRGWVALPSADPDVVGAVAAGARLGCASAAVVHGLWIPRKPSAPHLEVPQHSGRFDPGHGMSSTDAIVHWAGSKWGRYPLAVESVLGALTSAADCVDSETFVCLADSAMNQKLLSRAQLARALPSPRHVRLLRMTDSRADSGLETLARIRLRASGIQSAVQVEVGGIGRVDLLIGERLVIECDGSEFHDDPISRDLDRERDLALAARGFLVIRLGYNQIMSDWLLSAAVIRSLVERGEHLWRNSHRHAGLVDVGSGG